MEKETYRFKNRAEYNKALDTLVTPKDVQTRDLGKEQFRYLPIAIKEAIADYIFLEWNITEEKYVILGGHMLATVKIIYIPSYPGAQERFCSGTAGVLLNSAKNNLEFQSPGVLSEAVGMALGRLGNIFGRNLSRKLKKGVNMPDNFTLRGATEKKKETPEAKSKEKTPNF